MSDHDAPDESGIDRTWLCAGLILAALAMAAIPAWSKAAPHPRQAPNEARSGLIVLEVDSVEDDAGKTYAVKDGTVLVRGASITLIQRRGELVKPRDDVPLFDVDFDRSQRPKGVVVKANDAGSVLEGHVLKRGDTIWLLRGRKAEAFKVSALRHFQLASATLCEAYWEEYPATGPGRVKTSDSRSSAKDSELGCLVQTSGAVFVGRMKLSKTQIRVVTADGVTTLVPRAAVRWHAMGASEPTAEYWAAHPKKAIDTRYEDNRPASRTDRVAPSPQTSAQLWAAAAREDPKIARALKATTQQRWLLSADLWLGLYAERGKTTFFKNYAADTHKAVQGVTQRFNSKTLLARVDRLLADANKHKVLGRAQVQEVLASSISRAARSVWDRGFPRTAHDLTDRLGSLSPEYERKAGVLWEELKNSPPTLNYEGDHR